MGSRDPDPVALCPARAGAQAGVVPAAPQTTIDALEAAIVRAVPANFRESKPEAMVRGEAKAKTGDRFPAADPRRCRRSCQDSWCRQRRCYPVAGSPQIETPSGSAPLVGTLRQQRLRHCNRNKSCG